MLAVAAVFAWKQLLTTVAPVEAGGPLLIVPFILGLLGGGPGIKIKQAQTRFRFGGQWLPAQAAAPVLAPAALLLLVIALATNEPVAALAEGAVFALLCLLWTSLRLYRLRPPVKNGSRMRSRMLIGASMLAVSILGALVAAPILPGAGGHRQVLREVVQPP